MNHSESFQGWRRPTMTPDELAARIAAAKRQEEGRIWPHGSIHLHYSELQSLLDQLRNAADEATALAQRLSLARYKLEEIVCTKPPDDGVVLLSVDGPTRPPTSEERARGWTGQVYVHEHFSPLGDALIELWEIVSQ